MLRQVMIPSKENSTISIPAEFYGKEVEILVFPSPGRKDSTKIEEIEAIFANHLCCFGDYKFDRDEANDYD